MKFMSKLSFDIRHSLFIIRYSFLVPACPGWVPGWVPRLGARQSILLRTSHNNPRRHPGSSNFGELAIRFKCKTSGIILLRIEPDQKELRMKKMPELFRNFSAKLKGHLIIVDEQKIRFRKINQ